MNLKKYQSEFKLSPEIKKLRSCKLLAGIYSCYTRNKSITLFLKVFCIIAATCLSWCTFGDTLPPDRLLLRGMVLIEYNINIWILILNNGDNFQEFYENLVLIDNEIGRKPKNESRVTLWLITSVLVVKCLAAFSPLAASSSYINWTKIMNLWSITSLCCGYMSAYSTASLVFELLWRRMFLLKMKIKSGFRTFSKEVKYQRISKHLKQNLIIYRKLLENVQCVNHPIKLQIALSSIFLFSKGLWYFQYYMLLDAKNWASHFLIIQEAVLIFLPAIFAEAINAEVEDIRIIIAKELLICKDQRYFALIKDALTFLELRPPRMTIWRVVPINGSMPLSFMSLLTTYIIGVFQFFIYSGTSES